MEKQFIYLFLGSLGSVAAGLGAFVMAFVSFHQLKLSSKQIQADLTLRLYNDFFHKEKNARMIRLLEGGEMILAINGGVFDEEDMDDYLGMIELLDEFYKRRIISKEFIDSMFGHYIRITYNNQETREYIKNIRKEFNSVHYFTGLENLYYALKLDQVE